MPGFETKESWTEIRYRLEDPEKCSSDYGREEIADGVTLVLCRKKRSKDWISQALRFDKKVFPEIKDAEEWVEEHWKKRYNPGHGGVSKDSPVWYPGKALGRPCPEHLKRGRYG